MLKNATRHEILSAAVLEMIEDRFEIGDDGELLLTSPVSETSYDIYEGDAAGTFDLIVDDRPCMTHLPSAGVAKMRAAELIARQILDCAAIAAKARRIGLPA